MLCVFRSSSSWSALQAAEPIAYHCVLSMLLRHGMNQYFGAGFPKLRLSALQFDCLLEAGQIDPDRRPFWKVPQHQWCPDTKRYSLSNNLRLVRLRQSQRLAMRCLCRQTRCCFGTKLPMSWGNLEMCLQLKPCGSFCWMRLKMRSSVMRLPKLWQLCVQRMRPWRQSSLRWQRIPAARL
eukprot:symbB.v1.2.017747.t1/scaffold1390.1/size121990/4